MAGRLDSTGVTGTVSAGGWDGAGLVGDSGSLRGDRFRRLAGGVVGGAGRSGAGWVGSDRREGAGRLSGVSRVVEGV
jgi:hypothetical protein